MVAILMMSVKSATLGLLKIKVFWNRVYDVIISIYDVTKNYHMNDSSYIIDVVIWPNFLTSSISMREVITTSFLEGIDQKNFLKTFFERCSWFKVNNLGLIWPSNFILVWQKIDTKSQRGHGKNW